MATEYKLSYTAAEVNSKLGEIENLAKKSELPTIPTNVSAFTNDAGYLTEHQSLADYAKTADLGALATKDTVVKTDLTSDVQASLDKADTALQSYTETDPTVPDWAKAENPPTYTAEDVGADASGTATSAVSAHNTDTTAHADIRNVLETLSDGVAYIDATDNENVEIISHIDSELSETSENPVQNKVITNAISSLSAETVSVNPQTLTDEQKAQARENIGAVSAAEAEKYLDEKDGAIIVNRLDGLSWTTGFYYESGGMASNLAEAQYGTRYSDKIEVTPGDVFTLIYTVRAEHASNMWQAICEFDGDGLWVQRVGGAVTGTVSGEYSIYTQEYTVPANVGYLAFFARGIYDWTTPTVLDTKNAPTNTLRFEQAVPKVFSRLLPAPVEEYEGKTPVVSNGEYRMETLPTLDIITASLSGQNVVDLMDGRTWTGGFLYASGSLAPEEQGFYYGCCAYSDIFDVIPGARYRYIYKVPANTSNREGTVKDKLEVTFNEYTATGVWLRRNILTLPTSTIQGEYEVVDGEYTIPADVGQVRMTCYTFRSDYNGTKVLSLYLGQELPQPQRLLPIPNTEDIDHFLMWNGEEYTFAEAMGNINPHIRAINHRGYSTVAPENTLAAYRLSKKMGFSYVECDVQFTSDGVPVLLHDGTIDRTSNGTGNISTLALSDVKALDFGSWKSSEYAGEQIPTFEEFIVLCKRIGLHPYIEIKGNSSAESVSGLVAIVKRYGMADNVTWISFYANSLQHVKNADSTARLGYVTEANTDDVITTANGLKTDSNEVFISIGYYALNESFLEKCVTNDLPVEAWTINDASIIKQLDPYVSGYSSDSLRADEILYDAYR